MFESLAVHALALVQQHQLVVFLSAHSQHTCTHTYITVTRYDYLVSGEQLLALLGVAVIGEFQELG
jgi:hypothetical protein